MKFIGLALGMLCSTMVVAQITSTASGDWNNTSTWDCACIPGASDDVTIEHDVTVTSSNSVNSLTLGQEFSPNADIGTLTISSNSTLTVASGTTDLDRSGNVLTVDAGSSLVKTTGDLTISAPGTMTINGTIDVQSGDFTVSGGSNGNLSVGPSGNLNVSGDFTFAHSDRTVTVEGSVTVGSFTTGGGSGTTFDIQSGATFTITNALTVTTTQNFEIGGTLNVGSIAATGGSPEFEVEAGGVLNVSGDVLISSAADLNISSASGTVTVGGDLTINGGGGSTVEGDLTVSGAIDASTAIGGSGTVTASACTGSCGTVTVDPSLPVTLHYFRAQWEGAKIVLQWETVIEIQNDFFTIEISSDGIHFQEVTRVPGNGDSRTPIFYEYVLDDVDLQQPFFRLRQTDYDGQFEYVSIIHVPRSNVGVGYYKVYPNVASVGEVLTINQPTLPWLIHDIHGRLQAIGSSQSVSEPLSPGVYFIRLRNQAFTEVLRFVIR